jgi:hypothetical protein
MPIDSTSVGSLPTLWVASQWNNTSRCRAAAPMRATGLSVPVSLLADMMLTRMVRSVMASATWSAEMTPLESGVSQVTSAPFASRYLHTSTTALCSVFEVTIWFPLSR